MVTGLEGDTAGGCAPPISPTAPRQTDVGGRVARRDAQHRMAAGSGLGADPRGVACDASCRAFDAAA